MLYKIFNHTIYVENSPSLILFDSVRDLFTDQLKILFDEPFYKNFHERQNQVGEALTSVVCSNAIKGLGGYKELISDIHTYMLIAKELFFPGIQCRPRITRAWANVLFAGTSGRSHTHLKTQSDFVCIFYLHASEGASNLVIIDDDELHQEHTYFPETKKHYIIPNQDTLIFHKSGVNHAVTENKSSDPRVCIILEFKI